MIKKIKRKMGCIYRARSKKSNRDFLLNMMPQESICAEIGVWKGDFSERIFKKVNPHKLHLIDPWKHESDEKYENAWYGGYIKSQENMDVVYEQILKRFKKEIKSQQIIVHRNNSLEASQLFENNYFDWIYIDGNHLYDFVKNDLNNYYPKMKKDGFITGDDYVEGHWWKSGVKKAVDEFIVNEKIDVINIYNNQYILQTK